MSRKVLWATGPWHTMHPIPYETTLRLMQAGIGLGQSVHWCEARSVRIENGEVLLDASPLRRVRPARRSEDFIFEGPRTVRPSDYDFIHYRVDPPVTLSYLHPLQLLDLGIRATDGRTELVNSAVAIHSTNEKLENAALAKFAPDQLVSSHPERLLSFIRTRPKTVIKPLNNAGSRGIEMLVAEDAASGKARKVLAALTSGFRVPVQAQVFLNGIFDHEVRTLFVNGELTGCVRKRLHTRDFRVDIDAGSPVEPHEPNAGELEAIGAVTRHLRDRGIRFAALDFIDGKITDFNVTSPGLVVHMEEALGTDLASEIVTQLSSPWNPANED